MILTPALRQRRGVHLPYRICTPRIMHFNHISINHMVTAVGIIGAIQGPILEDEVGGGERPRLALDVIFVTHLRIS